MTMYNNKYYNIHNNASRGCEPGGVWGNLTDYTQCEEMCLELDQINGTRTFIDCRLLDSGSTTAQLDLSLTIYFVGYTISLIALLGAVAIFLSFREMRCLRHKIHIGLFLTLILSILSWIFVALIQPLVQSDHFRPWIQVFCLSQVVLRYFHLTTFFWMFLEGLYLFLQVQFPLSLATIRHRHFILFGWGSPLLVMTAWCSLKVRGVAQGGGRVTAVLEGLSERDREVWQLLGECAFIQEHEDGTDFYAYKLPVFILLSVNSFFLVWIMGT